MKNKKILIISFFFEPHCGVGAFRASYWAKNLKAYNYDVSVITSTNVDTDFDSIDNIHHVQYRRKLFIVDQGYQWGKAIKAFLNRSTLPEYNLILLTGGPFMQFFLLSTLKKKWPSAKLILDYRDPNSNNPRSNHSSIFKNHFKQICDNYFLKKAHIIITTNKFFKDFIDPKKKFSKKIFLIENGFDEQSLKSIVLQKTTIEKNNNQKNITSLIYPGPFTFDRLPHNLFKAIKELNPYFHFHHVGSTNSELQLPDANIFKFHGVQSYQKTLELINNCDIGIIMAGANEIGATTKLFDYIGLKKIIFIITDGKLNYGTLEEITKSYKNTYWCKNNIREISLCLKKIQHEFYTSKNILNEEMETNNFSRSAGLLKLIKCIEGQQN